MAKGSKVLKAKLDISDTDRGCYQSLEESLVLHPSESPERLLARLIAYALEWEPGLAFGRGLSHTDEAPIWLHDANDRVVHWVDIGQPDTDRLRKLCKRCDRVSLYIYAENAGNWWRQQGKDLKQLAGFSAFQLPWAVLAAMAGQLHNGFNLQVIRSEGYIYLVLDNEQYETQIIDLIAED